MSDHSPSPHAAMIASLGEMTPAIDDSAFVAPGAMVIGDVTIASHASVWYGSVLRGDDAPIRVGEGTNIQDLCLLHADPGFPTVVGADVTVGHRAVVHGAVVDDRALVGMGAVLLNGSRVAEYGIVAAGAVVREGFSVPAGTLVAGVPAKVVREIREEERALLDRSAAAYQAKADRHRAARGD